MIYGYVENNILIEGPRMLPSSWRNISGLNKMSADALKSLGWLPWTTIESAGDVYLSTVVEIGSDAITETVSKRPYNSEELAEQEAARIAGIEKQRRSAYATESDPIFFKWQRGEATQQEWLDKIAEIKARYPK
jgi:hypothetical protein